MRLAKRKKAAGKSRLPPAFSRILFPRKAKTPLPHSLTKAVQQGFGICLFDLFEVSDNAVDG